MAKRDHHLGVVLNERVQKHTDGSTEYWRDVAGYVGLYRVSDRGQVKSLDRVVTSTTGNTYSRKVPGRLLAIYGNGKCYPYVNLNKNNTVRRKDVHELVLEAFVGPRPLKHEACHFPDRDITNNRLENLRWGTRGDNMRDAIHHGTRFQPDNRGEKSPAAKLRNEDIPRVHELYANGLSSGKIAEKLGLSTACVKSILKGRTYKEAQPPAPAVMRKNGLPLEKQEAIFTDFKRGIHYSVIAERCGVHYATIYRIAKKLGGK